MSIPLIISGNQFNYPANRESPSWGAQASDWAVAVTGVLNTLQGANDIGLTTALINNNISVPANVVGCLFDPTQVLGAIVTYAVTRRTDSNEVGGTGHLFLTYLGESAVWDVVAAGGDNSGVTFTITSLGQLQYVSSNILGTNYSGSIRFKASAL